MAYRITGREGEMDGRGLKRLRRMEKNRGACCNTVSPSVVPNASNPYAYQKYLLCKDAANNTLDEIG
jgi:hypothetical protein